MTDAIKELDNKLEDLPISEFIDSRYQDFKEEVRLHATRDISSLDYELIRMFANELNLYWRAVADIKDNGYTNEHDQVSPSVSVRNKAANNLRQLYKEILKFCDFEDQGWSKKASKLRSKKNF